MDGATNAVRSDASENWPIFPVPLLGHENVPNIKLLSKFVSIWLFAAHVFTLNDLTII